MARVTRRGRGGTSPRVLIFLSLSAVLLFAAGEVLLYSRSDEGQVWCARAGLPVDRSQLSRTLSKTIRATLGEFGVPAGAQVIEVREHAEPRVLWTVYLPGRASTLQINAILTERLRARGAAVIDAWEDTLAAPGSEAHLAIGAGRTVTHEVVLARRDSQGPGLGPARLMLVVDGFAFDASDSLAREFLKLDLSFTGAVLPAYRQTREWADRLARTGREVLVQVPMEPMNYPQRDPGPGAILVDMPGGQIQRLVKKQLSAVPHADGATSYMGAMALQDAQAMAAVMAELKRADVFFLDARTASGSVAAERAAAAGVVCLRVDQRLEAPGKREAQLRAYRALLTDAVDLARRRGYAIVLVHPDVPALELLRREAPRLERSGVHFTRLSALLQPNAF